MSESHRPKPRILLLCDGTWCGRETGTRTNIYTLAKLFGVYINNADATEPCFRHYDPDARLEARIFVRYRHGVGLGSTFLDYLFNGITGQDLASEVIAAYKYIVNHFTPEHEIWLFGLSRGAYTVRCVAGMINNCGIIRRDALDDTETDLLCDEVYRIYRSDDKLNHPHSQQSRDFRKRMSWPLIGDDVPSGREKPAPPVRFMGLFDTVGNLGIPQFKGGIGLAWPTFHDDIVSSVVQDVCHLVLSTIDSTSSNLALHDDATQTIKSASTKSGFRGCITTSPDSGSNSFEAAQVCWRKRWVRYRIFQSLEAARILNRTMSSPTSLCGRCSSGSRSTTLAIFSSPKPSCLLKWQILLAQWLTEVQRLLNIKC